MTCFSTASIWRLNALFFPLIDHFNYGKLDLFVAEKDTTEFSDPRHCLSLGANG